VKRINSVQQSKGQIWLLQGGPGKTKGKGEGEERRREGEGEGEGKEKREGEERRRGSKDEEDKVVVKGKRNVKAKKILEEESSFSIESNYLRRVQCCFRSRCTNSFANTSSARCT
jgi:hypothetical protein